ncbi:hypothetical protein PVL30_002770 [Lodderomyces elongisporus]|uniref:uncharacterized protein n=1 Tax=Lodderomyces elongisporus TaxID=36914 RepID=UPI00291EA271|nr:uncharacterized protein PVL30_002770 [Lodderomyces elongisporus]WLF79020.1 hypothetical protein PVL30_002770 [Lodderomyces elongisporus]
MKLANALKLRANLQTDLKQQESEIRSNLVQQEGLTPSHDSNEQYQKYVLKLGELEKLIVAINYTNTKSRHEYNGQQKSITELILRIKEIKQMISLTESVISRGKAPTINTASDIRILSCVDMKKYDDKLEQLKSELLNLEMKLEEINWQVDLLER